jgi:SAM-dependent methyltransferase
VAKRPTAKFQYPKVPPPLNAEQLEAREGFMRQWHETLPVRYGMIERFNHVGAFRWPVPEGCRTLEIGAGLGAHLEFEDLKRQVYTVNELRAEWAETIRARFPGIKVLVGDVQLGLDCPDNSFDRIIAVHVLEHLPDLPKVLVELERILVPGGILQLVLPCEGGFSYSVARRISAQRMFEKRFKMPYEPIMMNEHVSEADEILVELEKRFDREEMRYFPFPFLPILTLNLVFGSVWVSRKR